MATIIPSYFWWNWACEKDIRTGISNIVRKHPGSRYFRVLSGYDPRELGVRPEVRNFSSGSLSKASHRQSRVFKRVEDKTLRARFSRAGHCGESKGNLKPGNILSKLSFQDQWNEVTEWINISGETCPCVDLLLSPSSYSSLQARLINWETSFWGKE